MRELARTSSSGGLTDSRIAQGLKEALRVGTDHAVTRTSKRDGYFGNELIKILLPESVQKLDQGLRLVGYGQQIDAFVLSMNRAAEQAAPQAKSIFIDAILAMSFDDARRILNGGETAATDFFKAKTSRQLYDAFRPVITTSMHRVGTAKQYDALLGRAQQIPFVKAEALDLNHYITNKALDGLFLVVSEEEKRIRKDPAARVTDVLRDVFGGRS
jgi:hypothetical protein